MPTTKIEGKASRQPLTGSSIVLRAQGFSGTVETLTGSAGGRAVGGDPFDFDTAAKGADVSVNARLDMNLKPEGGAAGGRGGAAAVPPALILPPAEEERQYAALQTDENGMSRWVLGVPASGGETQIPLTPREAPDKTDPGKGRAAVTSAMRRIVRIVSWATAPLLNKAALAIAGHWEGKRRPYGLRQVRPDGTFIEPQWDQLSQGPALVLVHGTFSTPQAGFAGWVGTDAFASVAHRYGDRVIALAHPSLSAGPDDNIQWMLDALPTSLREPLDIVCHSRGGLVSRVFATSDRFQVRRVVQVGVPNDGTPLADDRHIVDFLDGHTSFLTKLPDNVATVVLEGALCLVKLVAKGAGDLPGLKAMLPKGEYLGELGRRKLRAASWYTIGADYRAEAGQSSFSRRIVDRIADKVFTTSNDLVVPSAGCHAPGAEPVESVRLQGPAVHHTNYFTHADVHSKLAAWLQ